MGKAKTGAVLACLLLLPLPVVAYTIAPWSFVNNGIVLSDPNPDHKQLRYSGASGGPNYNSTGTSTVTASAGETLSADLNMTGLNLRRGSLTVTITVGSTTMSQTFTTSNPVFSFGPFALSAGTQAIKVKFQFSSDALFTYSGSTTNQLIFR